MGNNPAMMIDPDGLLYYNSYPSPLVDGGMSPEAKEMYARWDAQLFGVTMGDLASQGGGNGAGTGGGIGMLAMWEQNMSYYIAYYAGQKLLEEFKEIFNNTNTNFSVINNNGKFEYYPLIGYALSDYFYDGGTNGEVVEHYSGKFSYSVEEVNNSEGSGLKVNIYAADKYGLAYEQLDWIQSVYTNKPYPGKPVNEWYLDGTQDDPPFYYSKYLRTIRKMLNEGWKFDDKPYRGKVYNPIVWIGQLSLVGYKNGTWNHIFTIKYGWYKIDDNTYKPFYFLLSNPTSQQLNFINDANKKR